MTSMSITSIFEDRAASEILVETNNATPDGVLQTDSGIAIILPEPAALEGIMTLKSDTIEDLYTIDTVDENESCRYLDFNFTDTGVAYNETETTSITINKRIKLDQCDKCLKLQWIQTPCIRDGINFVGYYKVFWPNSITIELLVPGMRSYDPAGIKFDSHASIRIGGACAATQTSTFIFMLKALSEGANFVDIKKLQLEEINPLVKRYHGRIPLSMWMLSQLEACFGEPNSPKYPISYTKFIRQTIRRTDNKDTVAAKFLAERIQYIGEKYVDVKEDGSVQHLIEFLEAFEKGDPTLPIDYYNKIIVELSKAMKESKEVLKSVMIEQQSIETTGETKGEAEGDAKGETKGKAKVETENNSKKQTIDKLLRAHLTSRHQFELAIERLMVSVIMVSSRGELTPKLKIIEMLLIQWARTISFTSIVNRTTVEQLIDAEPSYGAVRCNLGMDLFLRTRDRGLISPLTLAAKLKSEPLLDMFLMNRKDAFGLNVYISSPNACDSYGWTALMHACKWGRKIPVRRILRHRQGWTKDLTFQIKVDPNIQDKDGMSALMIACMYGNFISIRELLSESAGVPLEDMRLPNINDRGTRINLELKTKPRSHLKNVVGESTALHIVASLATEVPEILDLLLQAKASTNQRDINGNTALTVATQNGHVILIQKLLDADADVNVVNNEGQTPLHIACYNTTSKRSVKVLLAGGADIHKKCVFRRTPIHYTYLALQRLQHLLKKVKATRQITRFLQYRKKVQRTNRSQKETKTLGQILIFTRPDCSYCKQVKTLFNKRDVRYEVVDIQKYPNRNQDMKGVTTPEVWFNSTLIGGCAEINDLDKQDTLNGLIKKCLETKVTADAPKPMQQSQQSLTSSSSIRVSLKTVPEFNSNFQTVAQVSSHIQITEEIINLCIESGADLNTKTDYQGLVAFDKNESKDWLNKVENELVSSSYLPSGNQDNIWKDKRTQISVEREWKNNSEHYAIIQIIVWLLFILLLLLVTMNHCALNDSVSYIVRTAIKARINGKPYDFSEQPNKRFLDTDTRQDVFNYLGKDGCIGNLYDTDGFFYRTADGVAQKQKYHMREKIFTVRHLRLVGNPRLRQLRAVCNSNTCPVGSPFLGSVTSETSLSCTPAFEKGTTYGEDKTPMVGMVSQHRYEWSDQDLVPNAYKFNDFTASPTLTGASGYSVLLPNNRSQALALLEMLKKDQWIDLCTRAVFFEFSVVNDYESVVGVFRSTIELPSAGFVIPSEEITVSRHRNNAWDLTFDILLLIFFVLLWYAEFEDVSIHWYTKFEDNHKANKLRRFTPKNNNVASYLYQYRLTGTHGSGYYRTTDALRSKSSSSETKEGKISTKKSIELTNVSSKGKSKSSRKTDIKSINSINSINPINSSRVRSEDFKAIEPIDPIPQFSCCNYRIPKYLFDITTKIEYQINLLLVLLTLWVTISRIRVAVEESNLHNQILLNEEMKNEWFPSSAFVLESASLHLRTSLAFTLLFAIFNVIYKLNFNRQVALFTIIIEAMILKLSAFLKIFIVAAFAFAAFAWILFGQSILVYSTFFGAFMQMIGGGTIQGFATWDQNDTDEKLNSALFHLFFIFIFVILLLNLLIAVMTEGYEEMRERAAESWAFSQFCQSQELKTYGSPRKSMVSLFCIRKRKASVLIQNKVTVSNLRRSTQERGKRISVDEFKQDLIFDKAIELSKKHQRMKMAPSLITVLVLKWYKNSRGSRST